MAVLQCAHCGAPRDPRATQCPYCSAHFADPKTGKPLSGIDKDIEDLIRGRNMIEAIKRYRERNGCGLREAKDAVDAIAKRLR